MVERVENYTQKDGQKILKVFYKPTKNFPEGLNYFYCDEDAEDLVQLYSWSLAHHSGHIAVVAYKNNTNISFHQEYAKKILGYSPSFIDHVNLLEFDNVDSNLNVVTNTQNQRNTRIKGYCYRQSPTRTKRFQVSLRVNNKVLYIGDCSNELEAINLVYEARSKYYSDYNYNFKLDRKDDLDILDLERTGIISSDEAIYRHVMRYASDNAWYYYRYNLEQYFKDNHIAIPDFKLDNQGFMIHPVTDKRLYPY